MSPTLLSALAKLDDSVRVLEEHLDCLSAGLEVSKDEFIQRLSEARQNADTVRELLRAKRSDVDWADRQSLEQLIHDLEADEAARKELTLRRLVELADELSGGTITHRLKARVAGLEALRQAAVNELLAEAAQEQPKELSGPDARAWMHWACGLQESEDATQSSALERDFPAVVRFVSEMEESYWQPRKSHEIPGQVDETSSESRATIQPQSSQLAESAPAFAAKYGHLSATKVPHVDGGAQPNAVAAAGARASSTQVPAPSPSAADLSSTTAAAYAVSDSSVTSVKAATEAADLAFVDSEPTTPEPYTTADEVLVEPQGNASRFGLNRSVLISVGATLAIVVAVVVISAVSGNFTGKRGSSPAATAASDSAKETPGGSATPVSDIELVGQIEQRLKAIKGSSIYVTVQHGTAILEGQVPSEDGLSQAEELTLQSSQIKVVRNRIQVAKAAALHATDHPAKPGTGNAE